MQVPCDFSGMVTSQNSHLKPENSIYARSMFLEALLTKRKKYDSLVDKGSCSLEKIRKVTLVDVCDGESLAHFWSWIKLIELLVA